MYTVLIVDDEPLICQGLGSLLADSGLPIRAILTATSGYEALDFIRMEEIDLLITDIQMPGMSGLELMHEAKMLKPWMPTVVVSAHETFEYAQLAIRLGAKDYLLKPLNNEQFLACVRNVLLKTTKPEPADGKEGNDSPAVRSGFRMREPDARLNAALNRLLAAAPDGLETLAEFGVALDGPLFSIIKLQLALDRDKDGKPLTAREQDWLRYGALNIACELLAGEWRHQAFYSGTEELNILLQWALPQQDEGMNPINQMEMLARSMHHNIRHFLGVDSVAGISQVLAGVEYLPELNRQCGKAIRWNRGHADHPVFYYGDLTWGLFDREPSEDDVHLQNNLIVSKAKAYIDEHYAKKGLTLLEVARHIHVSPNYLSYLFKKYMAINLWDYVVKMRMEESRRLLLTTDLRRYEIAELVGYESPEHFSKMFKKYFGMSPSEAKK